MTESRPETSIEDARWSAVAGRDAEFDGRFVYAVRTTGVCCRPSCPSRRPNRSNVVFFDDIEAARRAGFRPCRKCGGRAASVPPAIRRAMERLDRPGRVPPLGELAAFVGLSPAYFHRMFKSAVGLTPRAYAGAVRQRQEGDALATGAAMTAASSGREMVRSQVAARNRSGY